MTDRQVPRIPYTNAGIAADHSPAIGDNFARPFAYDMDCRSALDYNDGRLG